MNSTHKLKLISLVKKKTDKIDAEKLAIFLKMQITTNEQLIQPGYVPENTIQDLRSAPGIDSSNDTVKVTRTTKFGRKLSVVLLSQSLNHFRDSNKKLNKWYNKKIELEKHKKGKIRMALCRRVFTEIYQMLKKKEYHYYRDIENHQKKMMEYDKFLEKCELFKNRA